MTDFVQAVRDRIAEREGRGNTPSLTAIRRVLDSAESLRLWLKVVDPDPVPPSDYRYDGGDLRDLRELAFGGRGGSISLAAVDRILVAAEQERQGRP